MGDWVGDSESCTNGGEEDCGEVHSGRKVVLCVVEGDVNCGLDSKLSMDLGIRGLDEMKR